MNFSQFLENQLSAVYYHGSNSEQISGPIRVNERDAGWFGQGFYVTANMGYAQRWGNYIYEVAIPQGQFAQVTVHGNYDRMEYDPLGNEANQFAGGDEGWIRNEALWAQKFTNYLKQKGVEGVRIHAGSIDTEVVIFHPEKVKIVRRVN